MAPGISIDKGRAISCAAVENFMRQRHIDAHKNKIARSKSTVSNQWSVGEETKLAPSRGMNAKKLQLQEERYHGIERENRRLLGRMQEIERRGPSQAAAKLVMGPSRSSSVPAISGAGSRASQKVKELRRIDAENQRLLKKLQGAKASVSMAKYDESWQVQQRYMRMHCERQKDVWIEERAREQAELAAAMAQRAAARQPAGPFSEEPAGPSDAECIRLLYLQDELRQKAAADEEASDIAEMLDQQDASDAVEQDQEEAKGQQVEAADASQAEGSSETAAFRFGGVIPESSKNMVEQLLAEYAKEQEQEELDSVEAAKAAKQAAEAAFRQAEALDVASDDVFLSYERVVRNRKQREYESALDDF
eukprot:TRINITY_DN29815_c0_g2_i1.p1 TRINITY_DN29815_c0_g2~~TRINITY_DN29815_c0_g2_i1.p1  ORF type:complete len:364 (+),score=103.43 TRINITY_DN29815_c0_g2_i1:134-1225(+)